MPYSTPLKPEEIAAALTALPQWEVIDNQLHKTFVLPTFRESIAFVNRVADLAEAADHHPTITIAWKKVTLRLRTWAAENKITARDANLAREIEAVSVLRQSHDAVSGQ